MENAMIFEEWLAIGQEKRWVSEIVCDTHDGAPLTEQERERFDDGEDPCIPIIRVLQDRDRRPTIEDWPDAGAPVEGI